MKIIKIKPVIFCIFLILFFLCGIETRVAISNSSKSEKSKENAIMGSQAWSAFECSILALKSNNRKEQERLFKYGYKQGKIFITALKEGKILKEDLEAEVPIILILLLEGPSTDFMLGRIFENSLDSALKKLYEANGQMKSKAFIESIAEISYRKCNCQIVGR